MFAIPRLMITVPLLLGGFTMAVPPAPDAPERPVETSMHGDVLVDDEDREKRIRDLISHRSVLLDRVKACKATAESRVGRKSEGTNNNPINTDDISDDQEIAAFRSMTRAANQAARKSRELEASAEKRTSLSLRRGSSVGKRMNAALSSLVPGSNLSGTGGAANSSSAGNSTTVTHELPIWEGIKK